MNKYLLIFLLLFPAGLYSQNLVPNPGFEIVTTCALNGGGGVVSNKVLPWNAPDPGSDDVYNACSGDPSFLVPVNLFGQQQPHSGNGYIGGVMYSPISDYREYAQVKLISPLVANEVYCVSFWVSRSQEIYAAQNKIGMHLSTTEHLGSPIPPLNLVAQIEEQNIITDTVNWVKISGEYVATGGEEYIIIGCFAPHSTVSAIIPSGFPNISSYYYIDDVDIHTKSTTDCIVIPPPPPPPPPVTFTPTCNPNLLYHFKFNYLHHYDPSQPIVSGVNPTPDLAVMSPTFSANGIAVSNNLNSSFPAITIYTVVNGLYCYYNGTQWVNTNHSAGAVSSENPGAGGGYIFNINAANGDISRYDGTGDAINIVNVGASCLLDVSVDCAGNFYILKLDAPQSLRKYNSSGILLTTYDLSGAPVVVNGLSLAVMGNDVYYDDGINGLMHGLISGSTVSFSSAGNLGFVADFANCPGAAIQVPPANVSICNNQLPYTWHGNDYSASGTYTQIVTGPSGCNSTETLNLIVNPAPVFSLGDDRSLCAGETLVLDATLPNASYLWQDNSINPSYQVTHSGNYSVNVSVDGCSDTDTVSVNFNACECILIIPNVITPNGDGINDQWIISHGTCNTQITVTVFNRYGAVVYNSDNYLSDWGGTYNNKPCPDGTYYYLIKVVEPGKGVKKYRGNITLVR